MEADTCPIEIFPARTVSPLGSHSLCRSSGLSRCLSLCANNKGEACYALAQEMFTSATDDVAVEALFQRSCKLGVVSGCTNRAAGMLKSKPTDERTKQCAIRTFSKGCDADDPWACTMYAWQIWRDNGDITSTQKALRFLEKSCKYGIKDDACRTGMQVKNKLQAQIQSKER